MSPGDRLTIEDAARFLAVSLDDVWRLTVRGELRVVRGSWPPRITRSDLEDLVATTGAAPPPASIAYRSPDDPSAKKPVHRTSDTPGLDHRAVANLLGVSPATSRRLMSNGDLIASGNPPLVSRSEIDAYIARNRIKPGDLDHLDAYAAPRTTARKTPLTRMGRPDRRYGRR